MGRSVKVASPIVWQSKDHLRLRKKQEFIKHLGFAQIKAILREHGLAFDESDSYDVCVQRLVTSRWIPSRDTIQSYQRMFAKPVRSLEQKMEDRIRLCKAADVGNLSCEEMKEFGVHSTQTLSRSRSARARPRRRKCRKCR